MSITIQIRARPNATPLGGPTMDSGKINDWLQVIGLFGVLGGLISVVMTKSPLLLNGDRIRVSCDRQSANRNHWQHG